MDMKYLTLRAVLIFTLMLPFSLFGQEKESRSIKGKVIDGATGQPLDYATVTLLSKKDSSLVTGGITDEKGMFTIETKMGRYFAQIDFCYLINEFVERLFFVAVFGSLSF